MHLYDDIGDASSSLRGSSSSLVRQLQEKYREKRTLYHIFADLEKAFDCVPRAVIEWALRRQRVPEKLVRMVMLLYEGTTSRKI